MKRLIHVNEKTRTRAASASLPSEDDKAVDAMIDQMNTTTAHANAAIDDALAYADASNVRIAAMESQRTAQD